MIYRNKSESIPSQIETCEHWLAVSRQEESPFGRYVFDSLAFRSIAWLFHGGYGTTDAFTGFGDDSIASVAEYLYLRNPKLVAELVETREFTVAREYVMKECGENLRDLAPTAGDAENHPDLDFYARAATYISSRDYSPKDRVVALLEAIRLYDAHLTNFTKKRVPGFEKGAHVFGDFLVCFVNATLPVIRAEKKPSKRIA
jgi:hypothetical protein